MSRRGFNCKVVFLGDTAVGKSCLTVRFVRNEYFEFQEPTIGAAFLAKNIEYQGKKLKLEIYGIQKKLGNYKEQPGCVIILVSY